MQELACALPGVLDEDALEELATRLRPHLGDGLSNATGDQLLTAADAARRAHVHVETVRRAIRAGELVVAARIGRSPRLTTIAVDRWLGNTAAGGQPARAERSRRTRPSPPPQQYSLTAAFKATT